MSITAIQRGLSPVARAMIAGAVTAITPPASRGRGKRFWTVTLDTHEGASAVLVPTDHKIYSRVASRARPGHFWVVEADLSAFRGDVEIHARHVLSDKDTYLPHNLTLARRGQKVRRVRSRRPPPISRPCGGARPPP